MTRVLAFALFAVGFVLCAFPATAQTLPAVAKEEKILFRKALEDGRELVVIREPDRSIDELTPFMQDMALRNPKTIYPVRVELLAPGKAPLPLATRLVFERAMPSFGYGGFEILDALINQSQVILATAENGSVVLWQIGLPGSARAEFIRSADWTQCAAIVPLDRTMVKVTLNWTKDNVVEAEVNDLRVSSKQTTRFVQISDGSWKFKLGEPAPPKKPN